MLMLIILSPSESLTLTISPDGELKTMSREHDFWRS